MSGREDKIDVVDGIDGLRAKFEPEEEEADESGEDEGAEEDGVHAAGASRCSDELDVAMRAALGGGSDFVPAGFAVADVLILRLDETADGKQNGSENKPCDEDALKKRKDANQDAKNDEEVADSGGAAEFDAAAEAIGGGVHELPRRVFECNADGDAKEYEGDDAEDLEDDHG